MATRFCWQQALDSVPADFRSTRVATGPDHEAKQVQGAR